MKSLLGTTFDLTRLDMSTERINGGAGVILWVVGSIPARATKKSINNNPERKDRYQTGIC